MRNIKERNNRTSLALISILTFLLIFGNMPGNIVRPEAAAGTYGTLIETLSGNCGAAGNEDSVTWAMYDSDSDTVGDILVISGTGDMADYISAYETPWRTCQSKIKKVIIENGVTTIGNSAFSDCMFMTDAVIPEGITKIGESSFLNCSDLTTLTIPDGTTTIGSSAFRFCSELSSINIPSTVTGIGPEAFVACTALTQLTVSPQNPKYSSENGILYDKHKTTLLAYPSATGEFCIPEGITAISDYAFKECSNLTGAVIPKGVTTIGSRAFACCVQLTNVTIPEGVTNIGSYAFSDCLVLTDITIPEGVTTINTASFSNCSQLTDITLPKSLKKIEDYAFVDCNNLTSITIPEGVTTIREYSFFDCSNLTNVTLPESLTTIEEFAFYNCEKLSSITIPEKVIDIATYSFFNTALSSIYIKGGKEGKTLAIADYSFGNIPADAKVYLESSLINMELDEYSGITTEQFIQPYTLSYIPENGDRITIAEVFADNKQSCTFKVEDTSGDWMYIDSDTKKEIIISAEGTLENIDKNIEFVAVPFASYTVDNTVKTLGQMTGLPQGWTWSDSKDTPLPAGGTKKVTAKYTGVHGDLYVTKSRTVSVTRAACKEDPHILYTGAGEKAPTCTASGIGHTVCSLCNDTLRTNISVPAKSHTWDSGAVSKFPTAAKDGTQKFTCSVCGTTKKEEIDASSFTRLRLKATGAKKAVKLTWKKVKGADGYIVYGSLNGKKLKKIKTLKGADKLTYTHKKLKAGKYYQYVVFAYKNEGKMQHIISSSQTSYAVTNGSKYANPTKISVKQTKIAIKRGKTKSLKATLVMPKGKKSGKGITKFRYESSNKKVATVNKKGVVTAKKKGTAYIYIYASNGVYKKVKITVK